MRSLMTSILLAAVLVAPATVGAAEATMVAKVNGVGIPQEEFDRNWQYFLSKSGIPIDHGDKSGKVEEFRKQVLDGLVDKELLYQEAKRKNIGAPTEQVAAQLANARQQFPTDEAFKEALKKNALTEEGLKALYSRELTIQALVEQDIAKDLKVADAEVHDFYASNKDKFETPEQVRARHILVKVDETADAKAKEAAKAKADDLLKQVRGGADFGELAKKSSDCPSAAKDGDLGFFERGQMVEAFDKAAFALKPGEVSPVVETQFGYHIIKLEERKDAGTVAEKDVALRIKEFLTGQKTEEAVEARLKDLRAKAKIEVLLKP